MPMADGAGASWLLIDPFPDQPRLRLHMPTIQPVSCQYITRYAPLSALLIDGNLSTGRGRGSGISSTDVLPNVKEKYAGSPQDELNKRE